MCDKFLEHAFRVVLPTAIMARAQLRSFETIPNYSCTWWPIHGLQKEREICQLQKQKNERKEIHIEQPNQTRFKFVRQCEWNTHKTRNNLKLLFETLLKKRLKKGKKLQCSVVWWSSFSSGEQLLRVECERHQERDVRSVITEKMYMTTMAFRETNRQGHGNLNGVARYYGWNGLDLRTPFKPLQTLASWQSHTTPKH